MPGIDPKDIPLHGVLDGVVQYMKQTETAARRSCGYPMDLDRRVKYQLALVSPPETATPDREEA